VCGKDLGSAEGEAPDDVFDGSADGFESAGDGSSANSCKFIFLMSIWLFLLSV
jgi:hypothetical protein